MMILLLLISAVDSGALSLKRQAEVTTGVYLSDVLTHDSFQTLKASGVKNLYIAQGPNFSRSTVVNRDQVAKAIYRVHPNKRLTWSGPGNVVVRARTAQFDRADVEQHIRDWVAAYTTPLGVMHVEQIFVPTLSKMPHGKVAYTIRPRTNFKPAGRQSLWLDITVNGKPFKTISTQVSLSLEVLAATTTQELRRDQPLREDVVTWDYVRLTKLTDEPLKPEQLHGLCARSIVKAGTVLTSRHVKTIAVVERNAPITVLAKTGNLQISMRAIAMEAGGYGQTIRLKNPDTGKILVGRIAKDGNVHLDLN